MTYQRTSSRNSRQNIYMVDGVNVASLAHAKAWNATQDKWLYAEGMLDFPVGADENMVDREVEILESMYMAVLEANGIEVNI